ncbi:MAG: hypothetical protein RIC03_14460 [Cyclobacteriaceae bacterium]
MINRKKLIFLFFVAFIYISSCKSNEAQYAATENSSENGLSITIPEPALSPGQAILQFKVINTNKNEVTALFSTLEKQSFGFNTHLIMGDSITITTKKELVLPPGSTYKWVVEESKMRGSNRKTFRLIDELN